MSLLSICQAVAKDCGFGVPATIVGNPDDTAIQLLALINRSGKALARKPWQALQKEYTFPTVASDPDYALPADYGWFINDTAWDRDDFWKMRGSLSPQEWQAYKSGIMASSPRQRFRIRGNLLLIDPTPAAALDIVIEYVSKNWVVSSGNPFSEYQTDNDTSLLDEFLLELDLTWRFLDRKGLAYAEAKDEAGRQIDLSIARDVPASPANMAGATGIWPPLPTWRGAGLGS